MYVTKFKDRKRLTCVMVSRKNFVLNHTLVIVFCYFLGGCILFVLLIIHFNFNLLSQYLKNSLDAILNYISLQTQYVAQSAGAVEYTDCFSAEGQEPPNECPGYDTKQFDGEVPAVLELWGIWSTPLLPSLPGPL